MAVLVLTVIGDDRPGLVDELSGLIDAHGGNWEQSRMAHLADKFAGILTVSVGEDRAEALADALRMLSADGDLHVGVERNLSAVERSPEAASRTLTLELVGQDQPGIIHDVSHALAARGVGIEELNSTTESASMAGGALFRATLKLSAPSGLGDDDLRAILEGLANELMVDIDLD